MTDEEIADDLLDEITDEITDDLLEYATESHAPTNVHSCHWPELVAGL